MSTQAPEVGSQTNQPSLMLAGFSSSVTQVSAGFLMSGVSRKFVTFDPVLHALIGCIQAFIERLRTRGVPFGLYGAMAPLTMLLLSAGQWYTPSALTYLYRSES